MTARKYDRRIKPAREHAFDLSKSLTIIGVVLGIIIGLPKVGCKPPWVTHTQHSELMDKLEDLEKSITKATEDCMK